jgi:hypothetical protein
MSKVVPTQEIRVACSATIKVKVKDHSILGKQSGKMWGFDLDLDLAILTLTLTLYLTKIEVSQLPSQDLGVGECRGSRPLRGRKISTMRTRWTSRCWGTLLSPALLYTLAVGTYTCDTATATHRQHFLL